MASRISSGAVLFAVWFWLLPQLTLAQETWTGAGPDGGTVRALVIARTVPEVFYAGTPGGVFRRTALEARWARVNTGLTDADVSVLAVDPVSPATLFAGSASGVFRTTDGGATWSPRSAGLPSGAILALAIDPSTPSTVYAGTANGVYKTLDGGASWQPSNASLTGRTVTSLAIDLLVSSTVYAAAGNDLFKSVDGGVTWGSTGIGAGSGPGIVDLVAIDPHGSGTLLAARRLNGTNLAFIYRSVDGGASWISGSEATYPTRIFALAYHPQTAGTAYVASTSGVKRTLNGGLTWGVFSSPGADGTAIAVSGTGTVWVGTIDRGTLSSSFDAPNFGQTWTRQNAGLAAEAIRAVVIDAADPDTVYALTRSTGANPVEDDTALFKSTDRGAIWRKLTLGTWQAVTALASDPADASVVYAGITTSAGPFSGESGAVYRSVDGGATWSNISSNAFMRGVRGIVIDSIHRGTFYAITSGAAVKTIDGGRSWFPVRSSSFPAIQVLAIDRVDTNALYAWAGTGLLKTGNGGASWQTLPSPGGVTSVRAIVVDPVSHDLVYLGTEDGVFKSTNGGTTWTAHNGGLLALDITSLALDPLTPATVYAGTSQGGVFRTTDAGMSWVAFSDGLDSRNVSALAVTRTHQARVYAGTVGASAYSRLIPTPSLGTASRSIPIVYRPSSGQWFVAGAAASSAVSTTFGDPALGDLPVPADYDGDGVRDFAVYRVRTSEWFVLRSSDENIVATRFGDPATGDMAVPADYDRDGQTDLAVYRTTTGQWLVLASSTGTTLAYRFNAPAAPGIAVSGDYDGDGLLDLAQCRYSGDALVWIIAHSKPFIGVRNFFYGLGSRGDLPQPGDYDGDGRTDVAVYRTTTGQWFIFGSTAGQLAPIQFGSPAADDIPVAGDYDGDGRGDVAVYRKSTGEWFWFGSSTGFSGAVTTGVAATGDVPLTSILR